MAVALERAGTVKGTAQEKGWRVARGQTWHGGLLLQRPSLLLSESALWPPPRLPPAPVLPPMPRRVTSKQTGPYILYSGGIKITTKTLQKSLRELIPPPPPQPLSPRAEGRVRKGSPGSVGTSKDQRGD